MRIYKIDVECINDNERLILKSLFEDDSHENCIHGIKLRWSCDECEDFFADHGEVV